MAANTKSEVSREVELSKLSRISMIRSFLRVLTKLARSTASIPKQKKDGFWMIRNPFTSKSSIRSPFRSRVISM